MNKTQDIQIATACLRQFQSQPMGCSAMDIALAEGLPVEQCQTLLTRLEAAQVVETVDGGRFSLVDEVTALDVLNAVWAQAAQPAFRRLYGSDADLSQWIRGQWAQG
jgi:DNA-binding IclR family transcriptional regulator